MQPLIKRVFKTNGLKIVLVIIFTLSFGWGQSTNDAWTNEIHSSGSSSVALSDYYIIRFINANTEATSNIDLSNYTLAVKNCWIIFL